MKRRESVLQKQLKEDSRTSKNEVSNQAEGYHFETLTPKCQEKSIRTWNGRPVNQSCQFLPGTISPMSRTLTLKRIILSALSSIKPSHFSAILPVTKSSTMLFVVITFICYLVAINVEAYYLIYNTIGNIVFNTFYVTQNVENEKKCKLWRFHFISFNEMKGDVRE